MSRSRRERNDYGEKWAVAVTLMDKPCNIDEVEEHFSVIGRRFGVFNIDSVLEGHNKQSLRQWLEEILANMQEIGWIVKCGELYELTDEGRKEAEKVYSESENAGKLLKKALSTSMVSTVTFITHLVLAIIKLPAALISGSVGLLSDSLDTLADALSSLLVWVGIRRHKEEAANTILVILMLVTGGFTLYKAITRIFNPVLPEVDAFTFIATIISALLCGLLWIYQRYTGVKTKTPALITQSIDSRNHVFAAVSVIAGLVAVLLNFVWLDIAVGLIVAVLICKSAVELLIDIIKRAGGEEVDSFERFALHYKYRNREYSKWIMQTISKEDFASESELVDYIKDKLDTEGNKTLMAFGKDIYPEIDITIKECITKLKDDGNIEIGETIKLTEKGEKLLGDTTKRSNDDGMKYLKMIGSILWYVVEFVVLYFGIRYLSSLIGATMLWLDYVHTLNVLGLSLEVGNLVATGVGMFMYVFGRYHFARVSKVHRHIKGKDLLTTGYYKKSRHPMYGMMVTMQIGILSAVCFRWAAVISVLWFGVMCFNAWHEEKGLIKEHGDKYIEYKKTAKNRLFAKTQFILIVAVLLNNLAGIFKFY